MNRRQALSGLVAAAAALTLPPTAASTAKIMQRRLRPPGALPENEFVKTCIRCGQCGQVCPNRAIQFTRHDVDVLVRDTPYIVAREQACILCMRCGEICPTGAIQSIERSARAIVANVKMGHAVVDTHLCLSYQGKTCGVCYRACPLADVAIRVGRLEQPQVSEQCVGCGLCERSCIQIPQAIKIIPVS